MKGGVVVGCVGMGGVWVEAGRGRREEGERDGGGEGN